MRKVPLQLRFLACGLLFASLFISSCAKKEDIVQPINGYYSADEIAPTNLMAYWNFDGNYLESKSNATPTNVRNTRFGDSPKGQGVFFQDGYLVYSPIVKLGPTYLQNAFTITAWVLVSNNGNTGGSIISLANVNTLYNNLGNINFLVETAWADATNKVLFPAGQLSTRRDTTLLQYLVYSNLDSASNPTDYKNEVVYSGGSWVQLAMRFNSADSGGKTTLDILANGHVVSWPSLRELKYNTAALGVLNMVAPQSVCIGGFPTQELGFNATKLPNMANFNGAVDEIRIYNKALKDQDISALYQLEALGR